MAAASTRSFPRSGSACNQATTSGGLKSLKLLQITASHDKRRPRPGSTRAAGYNLDPMRETRDDTQPRFVPEVRSELLRSQLRRWTDQVASDGKAADLFELGMWLRSF